MNPNDVASVIAEGLVFPECPRWHEGQLWFCDMEDNRLCLLTEDGGVETRAVLPCHAGGIGWTPDGDALVVAMQDQAILRVNRHGVVSTHADLRSVAASHCNDMVIGPNDRAYVGTFGFDIWAGETARPGVLVSVSATGEVGLAAEGLEFPNAGVITPDGKRLIVAETFGSRLLGFSIADDGSLFDRRAWADLGAHPDGICLDAEGSVWVALPLAGRCVRVMEGGKITGSAHVQNAAMPLAVALGGPALTTLYIVTASPGETLEERRARRGGTIQAIEVAVPGAGWPK